MTSIRETTYAIMKRCQELNMDRPIPWNDILQELGYHRVALPGADLLKTDWCQEKFGDDHFVWTGAYFWFETEQDAVMFTLRWS